MKIKKVTGLGLILIAVFIIAVRLERNNLDETGDRKSTTDRTVTKATIRLDRSREHSGRSHHNRQIEREIRAQLAILHSRNFEEWTTDILLKDCYLLSDPAAIKRLLSDPDFGWVPLSGRESDWEKARNKELVLLQFYEALFERWGFLDFEGALNDLEASETATPAEDDSEFWTPMASLYKGGAQVDGERAFRNLFPMSAPGMSEFQNVMFKGLMEGWASSHPERAWDFLVSHHTEFGGQTSSNAVLGYFDGCSDHANWDDLRLKVEKFGAGGESDKAHVVEIKNGTIDMVSWMVQIEFSKRWVREEPQAALRWLESDRVQSGLTFRRLDEPHGFTELMLVVGDWIRVEPEKAPEWLLSWKPQAVSAERVFDAIASSPSNSQALRERASELAEKARTSP